MSLGWLAFQNIVVWSKPGVIIPAVRYIQGKKKAERIIILENGDAVASFLENGTVSSRFAISDWCHSHSSISNFFAGLGFPDR